MWASAFLFHELHSAVFFHFGIIVVSRVMFLPWELQHAGNEGMSGDDMNTSASGLLSALRPLEYNLPPAMLMQRISRASVRAGELRVEEVCSCNNEDSSSHLCGTVIVFPDIWWCPWQLGGLHEVCSHVLGLVTSVARCLILTFCQSHWRDYLNMGLFGK